MKKCSGGLSSYNQSNHLLNYKSTIEKLITMTNYLNESLDLFEYTRSMRRDFHRNPELGFHEARTASIVARELNNFSLEVKTDVGKTGVVALLKGTRPSPVILARFDMDALPVNEETGADYASLTPGIMHACGHDAHIAIGLTVARMLSSHRNEIAGTVKFVFQPAEEGLGGAEAMIADGVLLNPTPDLSLAMHVWNEKPLGWLGISAGPVMSASDAFQMRITGKGGHGAAPHQTIDPVLASAHVVTTLQSIVSRNLNPLQSAVVSITMIHGGEANNVLPASVELKGSLRSFEQEVRKQLIERFREISTSVAEGLGCQVQLDFKRISPPVYNDPVITQRVQKITANLLPESTIDSDARSMGSEDMAFMMDQIPGCFIFLGSANASRGLDAGHHHPRFDFDEEILPRGAALMATTITEFLST